MHRRAFLRNAGTGLGAVLAGCRASNTVTQPTGIPIAPVGPGFLFATGIENSYPRLPDGSRHDQLERTDHYVRWREDFELARSLGVGALRYGPAWYRTNPGPGVFDWSGVDDQMEWLRQSGLAVIADLCHFGVPDWIDGFRDPALRLHLAAYACEFAKRYPWVRYYTPINEAFVATKFSSMLGWWNECATGVDSFVRAIGNASLAHELAVDAILAERPRAIIVQTESFERFTPGDSSLGAMVQARFWNEARFAVLDLTLGRMPVPAIRDLLIAGGMSTADFAFLREPRARGRRWIGVDYYVTSEQVVYADGRKRTGSTRAGLASVAREYHDRYRLPLMVSETSRVTSRAVDWLNEQWDDTMLLVAEGIPVEGFTWFPLGDVLDWRHALREKRGDVDPIGLYNLARHPHPVAGAYGELIASARGGVASTGARRVSGF
jgi:beta-glucosidase/6-phospho-beta-glucosidase/beta-galactosidase